MSPFDAERPDPSLPYEGPELTVVIPLYNEVLTIPDLAQRLSASLDRLGRSWEVIVVDDGSTDRTGTV